MAGWLLFCNCCLTSYYMEQRKESVVRKKKKFQPKVIWPGIAEACSWYFFQATKDPLRQKPTLIWLSHNWLLHVSSPILTLSEKFFQIFVLAHIRASHWPVHIYFQPKRNITYSYNITLPICPKKLLPQLFIPFHLSVYDNFQLVHLYEPSCNKNDNGNWTLDPPILAPVLSPNCHCYCREPFSPLCCSKKNWVN